MVPVMSPELRQGARQGVGPHAPTSLGPGGRQVLDASRAAAPDRPLVILAHGTRAPDAHPLLPAVAEDVARLLPGVRVRHGYVEFESPGAAEVVSGLEDPVVVPLFLGAGYHVEHDLPRVLAANGPGSLTGHLGPAPALVAAVAQRLGESLAAEGASLAELDGVVLAAAGSRRRGPVEEARTAARSLEGLLSVPVREAFLSAAEPGIRQAVHRWHAEGAATLAIAPYLLADGHFARALHTAGAEIVAAPVGRHPAVASVVAERYLAAA